jgi:hypothetical protein
LNKVLAGKISALQEFHLIEYSIGGQDARTTRVSFD